MVAHCDLFAGRFGVKVNEYNVSFLLKLRQDSVNGVIWAVGRLHKHPTYQGDYCYERAFVGFVDGKILTSGVLGQIRRPGDIPGCLKRLDYISLAISMVAQRNQVYAVSKQLIVDLRRQARAARGIFSVGYYTIDVPLSNQCLQLLGNNASARPANYVSNAKNI
jgi:hypothetical protein